MAVANFYSKKAGPGNIAIFANGGAGAPSVRRTQRAVYFWSPGYDTNGNLYFEAYSNNGKYRLMEIPSGQSTFVTIALKTNINFGAAVQWDGKYISAGDQAFGNAPQAGTYELSVTGTAATLVTSTALAGSGDLHDERRRASVGTETWQR